MSVLDGDEFLNNIFLFVTLDLRYWSYRACHGDMQEIPPVAGPRFRNPFR